MYSHHLIRVGRFGQVGRFVSADGTVYPRRTRVICRTNRGMELGEVLTQDEAQSAQVDGTVLRRVTVEDQLLLARLEKHQSQAFLACERLLREKDLPAVLMEVEHLFDGRSLYFYFLGEVTAAVDELTAELATVYDAEVQFRRFAQTLTDGCGPMCGTDEASGQGCGSSGCGSCAVASTCGPRPRA